MLFAHEKRHSLSLPAADKEGKPATIAFLMDYLCRNTMKDERKELFVLDDHLYVVSRAAMWRFGSRPFPVDFRCPGTHALSGAC